LIGHEREFHGFLERAYRVYVQDGDPCRAAHCAFWLGFTLLFRGEAAAASGWLARAQRLVAGQDCVEQGYLLLPAAEHNLDARNSEAALTAAISATRIGDRFGDDDLIACARHLEGRANIQQGQVERGLGLLDEVMVAVSGGELSPIVTGLIYCSVIDACQEVFASSRAREWTCALSRWCGEQPEMVAFSETCLVRRAEVMQLSGSWSDALAEAVHACERASLQDERKPPAAALYRQGEIHRLRGEFAAAEDAYRAASRQGVEPQPGLALLRMAQGRANVALSTIRRVLNAVTNSLQRAKLLPALIEIALAANELQQARTASTELDEIAARYPLDMLRATAAYAHGAVDLAEGRALEALNALRAAFELWRDNEAPYETARVRLLIALAYRQLGDHDSADLELDAAGNVFERLSAAPDLARAATIRRSSTTPNLTVLTQRELQVLRHIAAGKTNKAIALELFLSERTVDRHVSNILTKFGVPSRAAATAYAYGHKLL
jgi:DNA-binding CsgD family transcriptional regulator